MRWTNFLFLESSGFRWFSCQMNLDVFLVSGGNVLRHLTFLASVDSKLIILMNLDDLVDSEIHISRLLLGLINAEDIPVIPSAINGCWTSFIVWFSFFGKSQSCGIFLPNKSGSFFKCFTRYCDTLFIFGKSWIRIDCLIRCSW